MRHVDEGTIHAWLDDQMTDPAEAAWVETHLRECSACSALLADAESTAAEAAALLAASAPAVERPPFDDLLRRAAPRNSEQLPQVVVARRPGWVWQTGWAASVVVALTAGWMARSVMGPGDVRESIARQATSEAPSPAANVPVEPPSPPSAAQEARVVSGATAPAQEAREAPAAAAPAAPTRQAAAAPARRRDAGNTVGEPAAGTAAPADSTRVDGESMPPALAERVTLVPPTSALPSASAPLPGGRPTQAFRGAEAPAAPAAAAPAPAALAGGQADTRVVTGESANVAVASTVVEWRSVPRTEAAARSGMPLYGIAGMQPAATSITANGRTVRTTYRLPTGATVELEQRRLTGPQEPPLPQAQDTVRGFAGGRSGVAVDVAARPSRVWIGTRGDVQITLRSSAVGFDLEALGASLRVD